MSKERSKYNQSISGRASEKQQAIEKELAADHNNSLSEVKNAMGDDCSYGEIKMMLALQKHLASE